MADLKQEPDRRSTLGREAVSAYSTFLADLLIVANALVGFSRRQKAAIESRIGPNHLLRAVEGTPAEIEKAFRDAFTMLERRITLFLCLPLSRLDKLAIKKEIDRIGGE